MNFIVRPEEAGPLVLGGKGYALARARCAGFPVPPFVAIAPAACEAVLEASGTLACPKALQQELVAALAEICPDGELAAVRSSATEEDGARCSFAGQFESFLFVKPGDVAARIAAVWRSAFSEQVGAYRRQHGLGAVPTAPAVLVQRMIDADAAGVAFSADPASGRHAICVVVATHGVAAELVSGRQDADTWHVDRAGRIVSRVHAGLRACLDDTQVLEVAGLTRRCAAHFQCPQDVEWAIGDGQLHLLQSRPITSLAGHADPDGALALWDSSNIAESYSGVTTPLTFSYIRHAYAHVYRQFCRIVGIDRETIAAHDDMFRRMLGLIDGRVYYNLLGWYRLLALLPAFAANRSFLDEMLGIRAQISADDLPPARSEPGRGSIGALARSVWCGLVIASGYFTVDRRNRNFQRRLDLALAPVQPELETMRADELAEYFHTLERRLLTKWDAPLVNDFFAMIFHGLLRRLVERWLSLSERGLLNDLLAGEPGIISVEPARRIRGLAAAAALDPELQRLLCHGPPHEILRHAQGNPAFHVAFRDYIDRFGDRCLEELKLESTTLRDDPLPLLRAVGQLAAGGGHAAVPGDAALPRAAAERRVRERLRRHPLRALLFAWVLHNARARIRDRENLRFERTRLFGRVRGIFIEIGRRFWAQGLLDSPRDIFWLELDEILGFIEGTASCTGLKELVALRRIEFDRYRHREEPDRRFETRGTVHHGNVFKNTSGTRSAATADGGDERRAIGCGPGKVRGPARVVRSPGNAQIHPGEILVAEHTDPGWVLLFSSAAGLVIEHGSPLSHAAIVARELGIPAVIGVTGACRWLADGDQIEIDGAKGVVKKLVRPAPAVPAPFAREAA